MQGVRSLDKFTPASTTPGTAEPVLSIPQVGAAAAAAASAPQLRAPTEGPGGVCPREVKLFTFQRAKVKCT